MRIQWKYSWPIAAAAIAFVVPPAEAQSSPPKALYVFEAIDDVGTGDLNMEMSSRVRFSGLELGESVPVQQVSILFGDLSIAERCDRYALLMMERPGRYLLELKQEPTRWSCRLRVRPE